MLEYLGELNGHYATESVSSVCDKAEFPTLTDEPRAEKYGVRTGLEAHLQLPTYESEDRQD